MVHLPQLILLFVTDQFRLDAFDKYITPNLYQLSLADESTSFLNAYVSTPTCTPARAGLLTGKSPWSHGMLSYAETVNCQDYPTTLPSVLSEMRGYETFTVGKNHFGWDDRTGNYVTHGFQHLKVYDALDKMLRQDDYHRYFDKLHPGVNPLDVTCQLLGYNDWKACPYGLSGTTTIEEREHPTPWTTRQALNYLQSFNFSNPDNRMFLKVSYHRPHSPYDPPQRLFDKYLYSTPFRVPHRIINNTSWDSQYLNTTGPMADNDWHGDPGEKDAWHTRAGYLASVEFVDEGIGEILDWLRNNNNYNNNYNLLDDSMMIWTSDHGDMNGDHNLWRKGYPYEGSSHVNLIMKLPKAAKIENGKEKEDTTSPTNGQPRTSAALVETRDVAVTLYDYLGMKEQVQLRDPLVNGLSLLAILRAGKQDDDTIMVRQWLDLEHGSVYRFNNWNAIVGFYAASEVSNDNAPPSDLKLWKYIFLANKGVEQLFCLSTDPNESYDLSKEPNWSHVLMHWRKTMASQFSEEGRGRHWVVDGTLQIRKTSTTFGPNYPCSVSEAVG